jgi:DNA-binding CsgD family transcriptional regulator
MDVLRAQMAFQGFEVPSLTPRERERVWYSLAGKRRRAQLAVALQLDENEIAALVASVRQDRTRRMRHR